MAERSKTLLTWTLRIVGVALLVWVLATQVQWLDQVRFVDGSTAEGTVEAGPSVGTYRVLGAGPDRAVPFPVADISTRSYGGQDVPDITYGAKTLLRRLGDSVGMLIGVLLGLAVLVVLTAFRWMLLLRGLALPVPFTRCMRLTFIGGFFNLAVPGATGGDLVKAWYAHKEAKSRYPDLKGVGTKAVLSVFVDRFVGLFGLVVFAACVLLVTARGPAYEVPRIVVLSILALGVAAGIVVISRRIRRALGLAWLVRKLPFQNLMEELRTAASLYRGRVPTLLAAMGISLFNHATNATACYFLAQALGIEGISLGAAMALVPLANLLSAIPLLPGGWGVGELAFAYFFGQIGVPATEAVGLSVVFRLAVLGVNLPGGLLWIFWKGHPSTETITADVEAAAARAAALDTSGPADAAPEENA